MILQMFLSDSRQETGIMQPVVQLRTHSPEKMQAIQILRAKSILHIELKLFIPIQLVIIILLLVTVHSIQILLVR